MSFAEQNISELFPSDWGENYPRLIQFVERYYEWLYRDKGLTRPEIENLLDGGNWLSVDPDKFLATGELRFMATGDKRRDWLATVQESSKRNPGAALDSMEERYDLDTVFESFETADGELLEDLDGELRESKWDNKSMVKMWLRALGFSDYAQQGELQTFDPALLVRCLKSIYEIKGTYACTKLFFNIFFGENVEVTTPKETIAIIDDNFVPDEVNSVIRDDVFIQEYSYIVWTKNDADVYRPLFNAIYMRHLHPAGFAVDLRREGT